MGDILSMRTRKSWDCKEVASKKHSLGEEERQMQNNMPRKSPQLFGSHVAGVPAPLWGFCGSLQGCASQKSIALSSVPAMSGVKGAKAAVEESLDPWEFELIHRKGAGIQRHKYPHLYVSTVCVHHHPWIRFGAISLISLKCTFSSQALEEGYS